MVNIYYSSGLRIFCGGEIGYNESLTPIHPQYNRDLNKDALHLWYKFGDPGLNGSQVIVQS